jgi:hypothetical protein
MFVAAGCTSASPPDAEPSGTAGGNTQQVSDPVVPLECRPFGEIPLAERRSPYDSVTFSVGPQRTRICYSRPSVGGRTVFGGLVPWGQLWRTGADEPTTLHLPFNATIAGLSVPAGSYSIYTVPAEQGEWTVIINRSITQWGHPSSYTADVQAQELGRAQVKTERLDQLVERFTIRAEPVGQNGADILLEWERTRVRIPIRAAVTG